MLATMMLSDFNARHATERADMVKVMKERERRALAAYWRNPGSDYPHPPELVEHVEKDGNEYAVLSADVVGVLAVYRVRRDGQLKRLKRAPDFKEDRRLFSI
jgi:hypothetical protein